MGVKITKVARQTSFSLFSMKRAHPNNDNVNNGNHSFDSFDNAWSPEFRPLFSNITDFDIYSYMGGRRFYNTSSYILPSDCIEIRRTDYAHELYKHRWYSNFSSPVEDLLKSSQGGRVLDCGCGSGRWSYEMAVNYPNSTFLGLDMVPIFSEINNDESKPLNLGFLEYNICNGLPFQDATFDFLFQRSMIISLNKSQWNIMLNEFARTIKPCGWLELMELQVNEVNFTKTAKKFQRALNAYLETSDHYSYHNFPIHNLLRATNKFNSIRSIQKKVPVGSWGGEFGLKVADVLVGVYEGMKPTIKQIMNVTDSEYDELLCKLSEELKSPLNDYMYVTTVRVVAMRNSVPYRY